MYIHGIARGSLPIMTKWIRVCSVSDLGDGDLFRFDDDDDDDTSHKILLTNQDGKIRATDLICTHAEADLSTGFLGPDGVRCPLHLSVFDLDSGVPQNPPAVKSLCVYNVKINDGDIYVEV